MADTLVEQIGDRLKCPFCDATAAVGKPYIDATVNIRNHIKTTHPERLPLSLRRTKEKQPPIPPSHVIVQIERLVRLQRRLQQSADEIKTGGGPVIVTWMRLVKVVKEVDDIILGLPSTVEDSDRHDS